MQNKRILVAFQDMLQDADNYRLNNLAEGIEQIIRPAKLGILGCEVECDEPKYFCSHNHWKDGL